MKRAMIVALAGTMVCSCVSVRTTEYTGLAVDSVRRKFVSFGGASWGGSKASDDLLVQFSFAASLKFEERMVASFPNCPFNIPKDGTAATAAENMARSIQIYTRNHCTTWITGGTVVHMYCDYSSTSDFEFFVIPYSNPGSGKPHSFKEGETAKFHGLEVVHMPPLGMGGAEGK